MEVNKKALADIFGVSVRTIQNWQEQGMPVARGGGKGNEVLYDTVAAIAWYTERDIAIETEKLKRELEELRTVSEGEPEPGTIDYERYRLIKAQATGQELKNARDSREVVDTAFCTFAMSKIAGEIASVLDAMPLAIQRRYPGMDERHTEFLKAEIARTMNVAAGVGRKLPEYLDEYLRLTDG